MKLSRQETTVTTILAETDDAGRVVSAGRNVKFEAYCIRPLAEARGDTETVAACDLVRSRVPQGLTDHEWADAARLVRRRAAEYAAAEVAS